MVKPCTGIIGGVRQRIIIIYIYIYRLGKICTEGHDGEIYPAPAPEYPNQEKFETIIEVGCQMSKLKVFHFHTLSCTALFPFPCPLSNSQHHLLHQLRSQRSTSCSVALLYSGCTAAREHCCC